MPVYKAPLCRRGVPTGGVRLGKPTNGNIIILSVFILKTTINFNLPTVRQCGRKGVCKCDNHTCLHNRWTTQGDSVRPASSTGWSARGDAPCQNLFTLVYYLYWGRPLPESLYSCLLLNKPYFFTVTNFFLSPLQIISTICRPESADMIVPINGAVH